MSYKNVFKTTGATNTSVNGNVAVDVNVVGGVIGSLQQDIKTTKVVVTDAPVKLPGSALSDRSTISARVWGANTVYFGGDDVTVLNGYPKVQFEEISMDIKDVAGVNLWAVCDTGKTCEVRIIEVA